jgi:hypothetical protein
MRSERNCQSGQEMEYQIGMIYDPKGGVFRGRDEIDRIAGVIDF